MRRILPLLIVLLTLAPPAFAQYRNFVPEVVGVNCAEKRDNDFTGAADAEDAKCADPDAFEATAEGFTAEAESGQFTSAYEVIGDATASPDGGSGEYLVRKAGLRHHHGQVAYTGVTTGSYDVFVKYHAPTASDTEICLKAGTEGFKVNTDLRECGVLNSRQPTTGWTWEWVGRRDTYTATGNTTPQRVLDVTTGDAIWVVSSARLDCLYLRATGNDEAPQCPDAGSVGEPTTAEYLIEEKGANTFDITDGTIDASVGQANKLTYGTGGVGTNQGTDVDTRFAYDAALDRIYFWHTTTRANLTSAGTAGAEDGGSVLSGTGLTIKLRIVDLVRERTSETYTFSVNSVEATYDRNDLNGASNSAYDFASKDVSVSYAADVLIIEGYFEVDEDLTDGQLLLFDVSANELIAGTPQTSNYAKCPGTSITHPECWMIAQLSGVMETPADTDAPTAGNVTVSGETATTATFSWTCTDAVSTVFTCHALYDDDNDEEVLTGGFATAPGGNSIAGTCTANASGLPPNQAHEVIGRCTDQAGNTDDSAAITDFSTSAASGDEFFISTSGSGSTCSAGSPCASEDAVMAKAEFGPGDTITVNDGTYGSGKNIFIDCSTNPNKFNGTATAPITFRAANNRAAKFQQVVGGPRAFVMTGCEWWIVDGFHIAGVDSQNPTQTVPTASIGLSKNMTVQNMLVERNNRYHNSGLFSAGDGSTGNKYYNNEFYKFARNGFGPATSNGVVQGNYVNSRCWADIPGGLQGSPNSPGPPSCGNGTQSGDGGIILYTAVSQNLIVEDNIVEKASAAIDMAVLDTKINVSFLGNILRDSAWAILEASRGSGSKRSAVNTVVIDNLGFDLKAAGFSHRGSKGTFSRNNTAHSITGACFSADTATSDPGAGPPYSIEFENDLGKGCTGSGFTIDQNDYDPEGFSVTKSLSNSNGTAFSPSSSPSYSGNITTAPNIAGEGICVRRDNSVLAGKGTGGEDIGSNSIYRYVNGQKTSLPRWVNVKPATAINCPDSDSGWYPWNLQACVAGVNDVEGDSYYDVADRLGITTALLNACAADGTYP